MYNWRPNHGPRESIVTWWRLWSKERHRDVRAARQKRKTDREEFIRHALDAAARAEAEGNPAEMHDCTHKLLRVELYERAWELRVKAAGLEPHNPVPQWVGSDLTGKSLLIGVCREPISVGEELRLTRFIAPLAQRARRCIVLAERRLVPLLRRSFPEIDVRPRGVDDAAAFAEVDLVAHYEAAAFHYAKTVDEMRRSFVRLQADPILVDSIRRGYRLRGDGPLLGIAWSISNERKVLPDLKSWTPLLQWPSATFVSLQYGDVASDLEVLNELSGGRVINDPEIDQLLDLDGFAAQISALDAVVSISNTTIDMAGMLGTPTLHIRDDKSSQIWPLSGPSPWYPDMVFLYKQRRPWSEVFGEARNHLQQMLAEVESA
jgi:hypothetical protein